MKNRRELLKSSLVLAGTVGFAGAVFADDKTDIDMDDLPSGLIYSESNQGKWQGKAGSHAPVVSVAGDKVTIVTKHGMSKMHYIVRHTLVTEDGKVIDGKTFYPSDKPVSEFVVKGNYSKLYATSFCNKHDLWVTKFTKNS